MVAVRALSNFYVSGSNLTFQSHRTKIIGVCMLKARVVQDTPVIQDRRTNSREWVHAQRTADTGWILVRGGTMTVG